MRTNTLGHVLAALLIAACGADDDKDGGDDNGTSSDGDVTSSGSDGGTGSSDGGSDGGTGGTGGDGGGGTSSCPAEICVSPDPPATCGDDLELVNGGPCPGNMAYQGCCDADGRYWFCDCGHEDCAWMATC
jgi:hypothetical protein